MASSFQSSLIPRIQVFHPTREEFMNFSKYIDKVESMGGHKAGIAKIMPPEGWTPRKNGYDNIDLRIPAPIYQVVSGSAGIYQQLSGPKSSMTVKAFKKLAEEPEYRTPIHFDYEELERKFWKTKIYKPAAIYGADVPNSLYDDGVKEFNIKNLNTIFDLVKEEYKMKIEGVNTPYLYFGMWKTAFAWHKEDMDLYSINYLHFGAPKAWYAIPPAYGHKFERLVADIFHESSSICPAFLGHKTTVISPQTLKRHYIPVQKITQEPGEFIVTFPFGYHAGYNHGFNCAEAINFALPRWIEYGKRAISCTCSKDCVKISMDGFIRKYQPDRYKLWKKGKDVGPHPEDPTRHYAAPAPKKSELFQHKTKRSNKK